MTKPIRTNRINSSKGYYIEIKHHPDLSPDDLGAFYHFGSIEVEAGKPMLTIDLPMTTELPDTPIISVTELILSGTSSHIKAQGNTKIHVPRLTLSNSILESVQLEVREASIVNSTLKAIEIEAWSLGEFNTHFSTFAYGGVSSTFKGRYLDKFATITLDEAEIVGNFDRRLFIESSFKNTTISLKGKNVYDEDQETIQKLVLIDNDPVITLPTGSGLSRGKVTYRLVHNERGVPHVLITHDNHLMSERHYDAYYPLATLARELNNNRYLMTKDHPMHHSPAFTPRAVDNPEFRRMKHIVDLFLNVADYR